MLTLKAAGHPKWYHPSSLTSGGRFANKSPAVLARQAAHGMLAAAWHLYTGGRPAECFRMRWDDFSVPGADAVPPVWVLGLAGILHLFQDIWHWFLPGEWHGFWVRFVAVQCLQCRLSPFGDVRPERGILATMTPPSALKAVSPFPLFAFWVLGVMVGGITSSSRGCACKEVCAVGQERPKREKGKAG